MTSRHRAVKIEGAILRNGGRTMEKQRVRICDIAQELGLSIATVSNVIHG